MGEMRGDLPAMSGAEIARLFDDGTVRGSQIGA